MFRKGDLIACEQPFCFVLFSRERNNRCDYCFKLLDSSSSIKCLHCHYVSYCSYQCQDESDEFQCHNHECELLSKRPLSNMTRLIARIINKIEQNQCDQAKIIGKYQRDWDCLMDHYDNVVRDASVMYNFDRIYSDLELIFGDKLPETKYIIKIYGKILINSFAVQDEFMNQIGQAIYLGVSIFDHSCNPSASYMFIGKDIYVKAMKNITSDDIKDIRITYIDELESTVERQRQLQANYYFKCDCERCCCQTFSHVIDMNEDDKLRSICDKIEKFLEDEEKERENEQVPFLTSNNNKNRFNFEDFKEEVLKKKFIRQFKDENNLLAQLVSQFQDISLKENLKAGTNDLNDLNVLNALNDLNVPNIPDVPNVLNVLACRIADFIAIYDKDIDLSLQITEIYRSFYGINHPRVALRLYKAAKISGEKFPILKRQLLNEARSIAMLITPTKNQIQHYHQNNNASLNYNHKRNNGREIINNEVYNSNNNYNNNDIINRRINDLESVPILLKIIENELYETERIIYSKI